MFDTLEQHRKLFSTFQPFLQSLIAVIFLVSAYSSFASESGLLKIDFQDVDTGKAIDSVSVSITSRDDQQYTGLSDGAGEALIGGLPEGLYEVRVSKAGYQGRRFPSERIVSGKVTPLLVKMTRLSDGVEEVLVVGTALARQDLRSVGTSVQDREALRSSAGSGSDVLRALDGMPGLFSNGEYSSFTVRGNGPRDNLILVDGIPFDDVVHFSDNYGSQEDLEGGGRYSVFAPNVIAQAEFEPGGWGAAYGGRAGSLLKLNVAEGNRDSATYTARLDIAGVEVGYDGPSPLLEDTSILFSARDYNFERLFDFIGEGDVGEPALTDVIFKSSTRFEGDGKLNLLLIHAPESYNRGIENVLASDEENPGNYTDVSIIDIERENTLVSADWRTWIGDLQLANQLYYRVFDENSEVGEAYPDLVPVDTPIADIPARPGILVSQREETESGWRMDLNYDNRFGRVSGGFRLAQTELNYGLALNGDWILYTFRDTDYRPSEEQKYIELTPEFVDSDYQQKELNYTVYVDQDLNFTDWEMRFGLRYDRDGFSDEGLVSPRWGAAWRVSPKARVSATAGRYFQSARFADRASDPTNQSLENEQIDQISLGFNYVIKPSLSVFIEPYYQSLSSLIVEQDGVAQTYANTGEGESWGFDTALTRTFKNGWSADMKYSYNQAEIKDAPGAQPYDADFNRPHSFSIGGVWELNERWKFSARWKWASGTPKDASIIHDNVLGEGEPLRYAKEYISNNTERFDSFNSLNFRLDYRRKWGRTYIIAFVDILNVLGSENPSTEDFNERVGEDQAEEGEMLPLMGLRLEW